MMMDQGLQIQTYAYIGHWRLTSAKGITPGRKMAAVMPAALEPLHCLNVCKCKTNVTNVPEESSRYLSSCCAGETLPWLGEEKRTWVRNLRASVHSVSSLLDRGSILPPGQCYCRFDYDWSEWSLSDEACKGALYQRAGDPLSGLDPTLLDGYYHYRPSAATGVLLPPNADQVTAFLYSDCLPAPPCSCAGGSRNGMNWQACFNEIQIYAADPDRHVPPEILHDAVSQGTDHAKHIQAWVQSAFPAGSCYHYQGQPYVYAELKRSTTWLYAWLQALGLADPPGEGSPMLLVIHLLLTATCFLVVLASLLVLKKLVRSE